ncbi:MAG: M13 family metallopeptidase [Deltaproteobacteria bacterium]|nr:M13 family metallopeptidase [Deltaproteobacteria bacterium]
MRLSLVSLLLLVPALAAAEDKPLTALPYEPSLNLESLDRSVDPCVDFYTYSCGGWQKRNPIPPDQSAWSVYGKLEMENLQFLWGVLEQAAQDKAGRNAVDQKIGDYFASCMDTAAIDKLGAAPLKPDLDAIAALKSINDLPALLGKLQRSTSSSGMLFAFGSDQDWENSEKVIGEFGAGGIGLPDRDYYFRTDAKSVEIRQKYQAHVQKMMELLGDKPADAAKEAEAILKLETSLASASLTNVEKRSPHNLAHHATLKEAQAMMPSFSLAAYLPAAGAGSVDFFNVTEPKFLAEVEKQLHATSLDTWKAYLRWHLVHHEATALSSAFDDEDWNFYAKTLRGAQVKAPRWKRCVRSVDGNLGEALGQAFVAKAFPPEMKQRTVDMTKLVENAMEDDLKGLSWMSEPTRKAALAKLHTIVNKVGYPEHWRDYTKLAIARGDHAGNVRRAETFEWDRQLAKIGKPLDRGQWDMTPPTVDAYYNPQMNDINFPAGVLQPPLFDNKLDDAPNYGNTGSTVGHELTHGFDDEGRQFDAKGNLKDWWTEADAKAFETRAQCIVDQYGGYVAVDDIHVNSKLTLGEDVADLGGTILAYVAWKAAVHDKKLGSADGFTPDQRFFVGFAQWACSNERPEEVRLHTLTNPHSPPKYRINGVVANMPEFAKAFSCKKGSPMVREKPCRVW